MIVQVNTTKRMGQYVDPTCWQNSTLRYVPPVDFPAFLSGRLGRAKIMRTWITLDEYWDYRTGITYPDYDIGVMRYPVGELHYPYDMSMIVPAPSGTRFVDYLTSHSQNAEELLLNVRRYEREVSDGIITYDQYEQVFESAVAYCKELAPNIRYVECCNEVDIKTFGKLTAEEYVAIYLRAHKVVKRLNEKHKYPIPLELGGFSQAHSLHTRELMERIMELLRESEIGDDPMTFYSYHMYNAPENRNLSTSDMLELTRLSGVEKMKRIVWQHEQLLERLGLPPRPVFLDEIGRCRATGLDGDSIHNAAGILTYLIAFSVGDLGEAYPFPWCTFHNPELQMSFTQYLLREDGTYGATPNGIALEMLHRMSGERLDAQVLDCIGTDAPYCAIATECDGKISILAVNTSFESLPAIVEVGGLSDGQYKAEIYRCNLFANNIVYRRGEGSGALELTETRICTAENGIMRHLEVMDKDCFFLMELTKA